VLGNGNAALTSLSHPRMQSRGGEEGTWKVSLRKGECPTERRTDILAHMFFRITRGLPGAQEIDLLARLSGFRIAAEFGGMSQDVPLVDDLGELHPEAYELVVCLLKDD
jgi:hypothetical protein